jgi:4-alpha-glucanotransferase
MARRSGILLHLTSLPSRFGIGDLGPDAYRFADFLHRSGQRIWQILPLVPTDKLMGNSPYSSTSAFAGNPLLVSPEKLVEEGFLHKSDLSGAPRFSLDRVDYRLAAVYKGKILREAWRRFSAEPGSLQYDFEDFCRKERYWLDEYALFRALKIISGGKTWTQWPEALRDRRMKILGRRVEEIASLIEEEKFGQFLFFRQWRALKAYCNGLGVAIMGDLPYYVHHDSADVWGNPRLFKLDSAGHPVFVSGVPPDYFSRTGQLWGNPVYDWQALKESRYAWWVTRIRHNLDLFDLIRIDHCRGLISYWEVPAKNRTAARGQWVPVPADDFFRTLLRKVQRNSLVAEDLGFITPEVRAVLDRFELPGMRVLLFAFDSLEGSDHHAPHNYLKRDYAYTGTHDNNTVRGWFEKDAGKGEKERLLAYLGHKVGAQGVSQAMIRLALMSVADTAIIPMQDLLGLGSEARMNLPAGKGSYWRWRLLPGQIDRRLEQWLLEMTGTYGR